MRKSIRNEEIMKKSWKDNRLRYLQIMVGISAFCLLFSLIYRHFSHGVDSLYMTYLCVWPFALGAVPGLIFWLTDLLWEPGAYTLCFYNAGIASVTMSSLLRGIMEIAGTSSRHQVILMWIGAVLLIMGVVCYLLERVMNRQKSH